MIPNWTEEQWRSHFPVNTEKWVAYIRDADMQPHIKNAVGLARARYLECEDPDVLAETWDSSSSKHPDPGQPDEDPIQSYHRRLRDEGGPMDREALNERAREALRAFKGKIEAPF